MVNHEIVKQKYVLGGKIETWKAEKAQTVTFIVTEDCNLRCKYCYITHKSSNKKMNFETAKEFIDYFLVLMSGNPNKSEAVILDFIGGEPLLECELISQICDYFKIASYLRDDIWYWNYRINITTNGVAYSATGAQDLIKRNSGKISVSITIDGTKEKHDMQRVFPDGNGSYDSIYQNIPLYISQGYSSTKVTFASDDLKYLKDSIISLWNDGITQVSANVVFEDVWKEGDEVLFEKELMELADYAIDNELFDKYRCSLFSDAIGQLNDEKTKMRPYCGAGKMIALGPDGKIYPCLRYKDFSLNNQKEWVIGNVKTGIDMEKVRPFMVASIKYQSDDECINCEVATGCAYCQGHSYDESGTATNFFRAKHICKMHKARVRASDYYFSRLYNMFGIDRNNYDYLKQKQLYFLLSDDHVSYCDYCNQSNYAERMPYDTITKGLKFARDNFYTPIFVHSKSTQDFVVPQELATYRIFHIIPAERYDEREFNKDYTVAFDVSNIDLINDYLPKVILTVPYDEIGKLSDCIIRLFRITDFIKVHIQGLNKDFNEELYRKQLTILKDYLLDINESSQIKKLSLIPALCDLEKKDNCKAGDRSFTLAPNGRLYICPALYAYDKNNSLGTIIDDAISINSPHLYKLEHMPLCNMCDAKQCVNCVYINVNSTNEVNVSPSYQCRKGNIEKDISFEYSRELKNADMRERYAIGIHLDPLDILFENTEMVRGYYISKS